MVSDPTTLSSHSNQTDLSHNTSSSSSSSSSSLMNEEHTQVTHDEILLLLHLRKETADKQSGEDFFNKGLGYLLSLHQDNSDECHWLCDKELSDITIEMLHLFSLQASDEHFEEFKKILKDKLGKCFNCAKNYVIKKKELHKRYKIKYENDEGVDVMFSMIKSWDEQRVSESLYFLKYQLDRGDDCNFVVIFELLFDISLLQNHMINAIFPNVVPMSSEDFIQTLAEEFPPGLFLTSVHESEDVRKITWKCLQITMKGNNCEHSNEHYQLLKKLLDHYLYNNFKKTPFEYPIVKKESVFLLGITKIICNLDFENFYNLVIRRNEKFDMSKLLTEKLSNSKCENSFIEIIRFSRALLFKLKGHFWSNSEESSHFILLKSIIDNDIFYSVMESKKPETIKKSVFDSFLTIIDSFHNHDEGECEIFISTMLENLLCSFQQRHRSDDFSLRSLKTALKIIKDFNYSFHHNLYNKFKVTINDKYGIYHKNLTGTERENIINEILKHIEVTQEENDDDDFIEIKDDDDDDFIEIKDDDDDFIEIKDDNNDFIEIDDDDDDDDPVPMSIDLENSTSSTVLTNKSSSTTNTKGLVSKDKMNMMLRKPASWTRSFNDRKEQPSVISKMRESFMKEQKEKFEIEKRAKKELEKYAKIDEARRKLEMIKHSQKFSRPKIIKTASPSRSASGNESAENADPRKPKRLKIDDDGGNSGNLKLRKYTPQKQRKTKMLDISDVIQQNQSLYQQRAVANKRRKDNLEKRLKPNLNNLYKKVLSWGLKSKGDLPPNTLRDQYHQIPDRFESVEQYIKIFEPLLILECWQSFMQSKEDLDIDNDKYDTLKIEGIASIDDFQELSCKMNLDKIRIIAESDLVVVAQNTQNKNTPPKMFLSIVKSIMNHEKVTLLCYLQNDDANVRSELRPETSWLVYRIMSLTPPKREYAALIGLPYFQYKDMILNPRGQISSPIPGKELIEYMTNFHINQSQAEAVHKVIEQKNGFSLIQGPPGTGKTSTILGIISALRSVSDQYKNRILACAPSNAAVDELERRLRQGIYNSHGEIIRLNVVRFGKLDSSDKDPNSPEGEQKLKLDRLEKKLKVLRSRRQESRSGWDVSRIDAEIDQINDEIEKSYEILRNLKAEQQSINHLSKRGNISNADLFEADVVCATLAGSGHETFANIGLQFSTVIVDEAAQAIELNTLIPLKYNASRVVLVGDPNQLPPTVLSQIATNYSYEQSLFVRFQRCFPDSIHLLDTQYRMHPEISRFPSRLFYNNSLLDAPELERKKSQVWHKTQLFGPYRFFDIEGRMIRDKKKSSYNTDEAFIAVKLFLTLVKKFTYVDFKDKVGIITPYKRQLIELRTKFKQQVPESYYSKIEFNTVDGFQGREKDIIIFSCVRVGEDKGIGFLQDIRRMNVALTRAKCSLFILGNKAALESNLHWKALIQDAIQRGFYTDCSDLTFERGLL